MRVQDKSHLLHFMILLILLSIMSLLILAFQYEPAFQMVLVVTFGSVYLLWGIIHHHKLKDLHPRITIEYLIISILGTSLLASLLLRL